MGGGIVFELGGLIRALLRRKAGGPVANLKSVTVWAQELPENDLQEAQEAIVAAMVSINGNRSTPLIDRIQVLMYLDEKAAGLQDSLYRDYLAHGTEPNAPESLYPPTITSFWEALAAGYHRCIREFAQNAAGRRVRQKLPFLTARAMRCYAMQAKWCHMRYLPVESRVWRRLHRLYLLAERQGFARTPLRLYPHANRETTCAAEYLQPLLLSLANPDSLLPAEIEMADLWLDSWSQYLTLETEFRPQRQLYAVNLADGKPGKRLRRNMLGEKYRYWSVHPLLERVASITESLKNGELPARLGLGEDCRLPGCLDLIELVTARWTGQGGARRHERRERADSVQVTLGLRAVLEQLQPGRKPGAPRPVPPPDEHAAMDYRPDDILAPVPSPGEGAAADPEELFEDALPPWTMENESVSGYAVAFDQGGGRSPGIGTLIGLRPDRKTLAVGVVRRMNRDLSGRVQLGIETLALSPIAVKLHPPPSTRGNAPLDALYLPGLPDCQVARSLLIPSKAYARERVMELKAQGKSYTIRFQQVPEQTEDYARVQFEVLAKH